MMIAVITAIVMVIHINLVNNGGQSMEGNIEKPNISPTEALDIFDTVGFEEAVFRAETVDELVAVVAEYAMETRNNESEAAKDIKGVPYWFHVKRGDKAQALEAKRFSVEMEDLLANGRLENLRFAEDADNPAGRLPLTLPDALHTKLNELLRRDYL